MDDQLRRLSDRLGRLEDERAILVTLHTYGSAIDYGREAEFRDCWVQDATLIWPMRDPLVGLEPIMDAFRAHTHAPDRYHKHFVVDPVILVEGDEAQVESYFARLDHRAEGPSLSRFGRYIDRLVRCPDGRWRFRERRAELESRVVDPP